MSAARLASAMLVFAGFALYGKVRGARLQSEADEVSALASDLSEFEGMIANARLRLPAIAKRLSEKSLTGVFWQCVASGLERGLSPASAYDEAESRLACSGAKPALEELFASVGSSDAESELKRLGFVRQRLEALSAEAMKKAEESKKLKGSLSALLGLAAALLLL